MARSTVTTWRRALIIGSILLCAAVIPAIIVRAQLLEMNGAGENVTFHVDGSNMYFYDNKQNTIYVYSSRGEFLRAFQLEQLGERLKKLSYTEIKNISEKA